MADVDKAAAASRTGRFSLRRLTAALICTWPYVRGGVAGFWGALGAILFQLQARLAQDLLRQAGIHIISVVHACLCKLAAALLEGCCVQQRSRRRTWVVSIQRAMCGEKRPGPSR